MVRRVLIGALLVLALLGLGLRIHSAQAGPAAQSDSPVRGAMLYDNWYAVKGVGAPGGNMPVWDTQQTNTASGPDTWRCVSCHGWDYQGRDGAYRYGSNYTGFPGVYSARNKGANALIGTMRGTNNPGHNFSAYLDDQDMADLANFIASGTIDDNEFIDPQTLNVKDGDLAHGKQLYDQSCAGCHGADGKKIEFRFEGRTAWLGTLATLDPWRFLHKTRFGTPGTPMVIGYDLGWTPQDGRDVLVYARSLPNTLDVSQDPSLEGREQPSGQEPGGPGRGVFSGILTALGAMVTGVGFAVLIGGLLVGVIFLLVWVLRGQNK